jgi:DMSO/TMAO reductase YedYZ molybdopterin-dependent catalytic subunit
MKNKVYLSAVGSIFIAVMFFSCASQQLTVRKEPEISDEGFPSFITPVESYYVTRIGDVPRIMEDTYSLRVEGLVDRPRSYTLDELYAMDLIELPLTVECIGNSPSGPLVSTAVWEGFLLYDFLQSLGVSDRATGVRYEAADGYYASHTMEQIRDNGVLVALYMNGEPIPPLHGFPVRVLNPGYYGVKQPAWVTRIEVIDRPLEDYWDDRGWDVSPPIAVDSVIFTPENTPRLEAGETLRITGAAFGGTRIDKVELTDDGGSTWVDANIVEQGDADNLWVFWEAELSFMEKGKYVVNVRATDTEGNSQQEDDPDRYDGSNDWPMLRVTVR